MSINRLIYYTFLFPMSSKDIFACLACILSRKYIKIEVRDWYCQGEDSRVWETLFWKEKKTGRGVKKWVGNSGRDSLLVKLLDLIFI